MKDINLKIIVYNNNEVRFQDKIGEKKQDALKHRVAKIADGYRSQLNEEERSRIKSLQFVIKPDGKFRIVADFKKVKTEIGENQLDFAKKDIQRLLKTMQRLNLLPQAKPSPAAPLISPYFRETFHKKSVSFVQNLIKFFQTFTVFYLELRPLANKLLEKPINDAATRDDLINLYIQPDPQLFREIRDHIQKNHPAIYSNFSQDEIDHFVNDLMLEKINKKLVSLKALPIDEKEHYRLDIQRMLVHLASDPSSKKAYTELMTSNPLEIPIDELAKIPVKEGQSEALAQVWEGILKNLFKIGRLDTLALKSDTSGLLVQTEYAHKYLEVFDKMPESIERNLKDFIDELNVRQPVNNLKSFIVHHSLVYSENISFEDLTEKQKVYREQVRPSIQAFIASNEKKQKDSNALIKYLILAGNSKKEMDSVLDKIHEDLLRR